MNFYEVYFDISIFYYLFIHILIIIQNKCVTIISIAYYKLILLHLFLRIIVIIRISYQMKIE